MKSLVATCLVAALLVSGYLVGREQQRQKDEVYLSRDVCLNLVCQGADQEIQHWLNMYSFQEDRYTACEALNRVYQAVINRNPECYTPIKATDIEEISPPSQ